jgi:hypothetical protein
MKPFDYEKYLKNNPLLKENQEIEKTTTSNIDSYIVGFFYNDYPSITDRHEAGANQRFVKLVNRLGGTAEEIKDTFAERQYNIQGVKWEILLGASEKAFPNRQWIVKKDPVDYDDNDDEGMSGMMGM